MVTLNHHYNSKQSPGSWPKLSEWMEISGRFGSYTRATDVLEVAMESP